MPKSIALQGQHELHMHTKPIAPKPSRAAAYYQFQSFWYNAIKTKLGLMI